MRSIKRQYKAISAPIDDLITYRALPTNEISYIDPFLFLNHHGPQVYQPHNRGLPFGPHPHRGFETLTYILKGDIMHRDSSGGQSVINEGGIQWMTAGRGLIHTEVSSEQFKEQGGEVEIIQLWLNLPAKLKMIAPHYIGLQQDQLPIRVMDDGNIVIQVISGNWEDTKGPIDSLSDIQMSKIDLSQGGSLRVRIPADRNILFYVVKGNVNVNQQTAFMHHLVEFNNDGEEILIEASEPATVIFGHAKPFNEPVVSHGPFVMNTQTEIMEAMRDYQMGKMGVWIE